MILDLREAFRLADELKLQFIELSHDLHEFEPSLQAVPAVRELSRATGIGVTVHLSYVDLNIASIFPGVRENSVTRTQRGLEYAAELGAHCAVLHSGLVPLRHPLMLERAHAALTQSLSEIQALVPIALENLALDRYDLLRGPAELEAITRHANIGNTLDVGHALVEGSTTERDDGTGAGGLEAGLARLDSYVTGLSHIIHLHLQDNDGSSDQHRTLGTAGIRWERLREFLRGFQGTVDLEITGSADDVRESVRFVRELVDKASERMEKSQS